MGHGVHTAFHRKCAEPDYTCEIGAKSFPFSPEPVQIRRIRVMYSKRLGAASWHSGAMRFVGAALAVMLLVGCGGSSGDAIDGGPESGTDAGPGSPIGEPDDEAAFIYDQDSFLTFDLRLTAENLAFLNDDPTAEQYVEGSVIFDGVEYGPVGIRYKGSYGAWVGCTEAAMDNPLGVGGAKTCPKLNIKVSFNWSDPEGRFFGLKKLQFHAMNHDPSMMRERLGYMMFRDMGVPAPRATHARVLINGELSGVYINVEYIDGRFTRSRFTDGKGNLYKEVWPTYSVNQPTTTPGSLLAALRTNEDENPSVDKMIAFGEAVMSAEGDDRADAIDAWMDVDNTMRMVAVDRTIRADDGLFHFYCGPPCSNHNYYVYEEELSDRVWVIPWDLDNAFVVIRQPGLTADSFVKVMDEWDDHTVTCEPRSGGSTFSPRQLPPSCDPLINGWASFGASYDAAVAELVDGPFAADRVDALIAAWDAQITATVDEAYAADSEQRSAAEWQAGITDFRERTQILRDAAANGVPPP